MPTTRNPETRSRCLYDVSVLHSRIPTELFGASSSVCRPDNIDSAKSMILVQPYVYGSHGVGWQPSRGSHLGKPSRASISESHLGQPSGRAISESHLGKASRETSRGKHLRAGISGKHLGQASRRAISGSHLGEPFRASIWGKPLGRHLGSPLLHRVCKSPMSRKSCLKLASTLMSRKSCFNGNIRHDHMKYHCMRPKRHEKPSG